jgi:hypothetical protein
MKYLKILIDPIKIKGDPEDTDTLQADLYEKIQAMIESETLKWNIDEEDQDEDDD